MNFLVRNATELWIRNLIYLVHRQTRQKFYAIVQKWESFWLFPNERKIGKEMESLQDEDIDAKLVFQRSPRVS